MSLIWPKMIFKNLVEKFYCILLIITFSGHFPTVCEEFCSTMTKNWKCSLMNSWHQDLVISTIKTLIRWQEVANNKREYIINWFLLRNNRIKINGKMNKFNWQLNIYRVELPIKMSKFLFEELKVLLNFRQWLF